MANTTAKKTTKEIKDIDVSKIVNRVKEGAADVNEFLIENSEEIVKGAIVRGEQWQNVASKAVQGGLKLTANSQDIVFDTLDALKIQLTDSRSRIKSLFSKN